MVERVASPTMYRWEGAPVNGTGFPQTADGRFKVVAYEFRYQIQSVAPVDAKGMPRAGRCRRPPPPKRSWRFRRMVSSCPTAPAIPPASRGWSKTSSTCSANCPSSVSALATRCLVWPTVARPTNSNSAIAGGNQPVKDLLTGKVEITSQNHGFCVDPKSLPESVEVTHINLNDGSLEGMRHKEYPAFSVQYHPEYAPGPHDAEYLFDRFMSTDGAGELSARRIRKTNDALNAQILKRYLSSAPGRLSSARPASSITPEPRRSRPSRKRATRWC